MSCETCKELAAALKDMVDRLETCMIFSSTPRRPRDEHRAIRKVRTLLERVTKDHNAHLGAKERE